MTASTSRPRWIVVAVLLAAALATPAAAVGEEVAPGYEIGIEDVLRIVVWGETDLSDSVKVRPDGKITMPLINDIAVVGMTPEAVREKIAGELKEFVRDPNVTVIVDEINSFRIYFLGEVNNQGPIQFYKPTRLLQALASAGGMTEFAKKDVTLLREQDGGEVRMNIDVKKVMAGEDENPRLLPGDTLLVK